jgi:DNA-binding SARP family transcriptional activator
MRFGILGPLEVINTRGPVPLRAAKPRALLCALLLNANRTVSAERLASALWGEDAPSGSTRTVHVHVSRLRKLLGEEFVLATAPLGYRLEVRADELDAHRFEMLVEEGRRALNAGQFAHAAALLREALSLWRGGALEDVAYEPFAQSEIARLEEERLGALEMRVEADLAVGRHRELVHELQGLVSASPARERLAELFMIALYRCGRQGEALDVYARARAFLDRELGLEPGRGLKSLHRSILEQDASLELQGPGAVEAATSSDDSEGTFPAPLALTAAAGDMFVGRAADMRALTDGYAEVAGGARRLMLVCGEPGVGKTRLAAEFSRHAHAQGAIVLYGHCDEEALLAQQPFVEALRHYVRVCPADRLARRPRRVSGELRRIVPEIADRIPDLPEPLAGDPEGARARLFEAVASLLYDAAQTTSVVLVLDDLHWADTATLLLLKYLVRYPRTARLMILGLYRETELDVDHPLVAILTDLGREHRFERWALRPLDAEAVSELVDFYAGNRAPSELRQVVYEGTEGNAFFVVEMLRHFSESGAIDVSGANPETVIGALAVPETVKDVVGRRIARLGRETKQRLETAAVFGRAFELRVLQRMFEADTLIDSLESAVSARVIQEISGRVGHYAFSHGLIRETLYGGLTSTRRALLHRRAGDALEAAHASNPEPYLAELAHHFAEGALDGDLDQAIEYARRAAEYAITQSAHEQAAAHLRRAVELIETIDPTGHQHPRCDLLIAQGQAERAAGDPVYRQTLLLGAQLAQRLHDPERLARAALANTRGIYSSGQGIDGERVAVIQAALNAYDPADSPTRAALQSLLALELVTDHDSHRRDTLNEEAVAMARRIRDPRIAALVLTQRCVAQWSPAMTAAQRRADLREAAVFADRLDDPLLAGHIAYYGAHAAMNDGDLEESDRLLARLSAIAEELAQPFLRWFAALAHAKRRAISGPPDEAERLAFVALEIGRRAGQPDSELWFLGQVLAARFLQGSLDRGAPHLPDLFGLGESPPTGPEITPNPSIPLLIGAAMSMILCEVGRLEDGREHFELLMSRGLDDLPPDYLAILIPVYASVACAHLGDASRADRLRELLDPHRERLVTTGASWFGATTHYLGLLAAVLGRSDEADARFADAQRTYATLNAQPWLARLHSDRSSAARGARRRGSDAIRLERSPGRGLAEMPASHVEHGPTPAP